MKILHLSDTTLSGSPIRISDLLNKWGKADNVESRHIVWEPTMGYRTFKTDMVGKTMSRAELMKWVYEWPDIIHYHNRWHRQNIFRYLGDGATLLPPKKLSVIQIHSPRLSEDFKEEVASGVPLAIIGQYHVREWPEASYIVPNVVDISEPDYDMSNKPAPNKNRPVVSFAPSNTNARGWDDKGHGVVSPVLKKMKFRNEIYFQFINQLPHSKVMELKKSADIGIDEIVTGSYHLSSLEYLGMGVPCFSNIDSQTCRVVMDLSGCKTLPWIKANKDNFEAILKRILREGSYEEYGRQSRKWMEDYWGPEALYAHYTEMYKNL